MYRDGSGGVQGACIGRKGYYVVIALLGLENQTKPDENMPLRVISYEGASYKSQLLDGEKNFYPVITLVLHFGKQHWEKARSLYEKLEVPALRQ